MAPPLGCTKAPDGSLTFAYQDASAARVLVAGDFTGWAADPVPLVRQDGTDLWTLTIRPPKSSVHSYKYIVDERWISDPENPLTLDDGVGGRNSAFVMGGRSLGEAGAIRVLTLNLHTWQERSARAKLERIAFGVAAHGVDVLLLQEVGEHVSNPAEPNAGRLLQEHLQRFTRRAWSHEWREAHIGFGAYREGLSILSSGPLEDVSLFRLSEGPMARIALVGRTQVNGVSLRVVTTHVAWGDEGGAQIERLVAELGRLPRGDHAATIVAGDLNAGPSEPQVARFVEKGYVDVGFAAKNTAPTFGEGELSRRIDYQLLRTAAGRKPPRVEGLVRVFDGEKPVDGLDPRVSDHAGLVGVYRWDEG